jgi:hypothetical protein
MAKKQTTAEVSAIAARILGMTDDEIYAEVVGPTNMPVASLPRSTRFPQLCREIRSICASAMGQDERK